MHRLLGAAAVLPLAVCGADGHAAVPAARPAAVAAPSAPSPAPAASATASATASPAPSPSPVSTRAVARYLAGRPGRAAVFVRDLRTGRTFAYHAHERFITASVMKVNILVSLLVRRKSLTEEQWDLAEPMIRYSDNAAADALYRLAGYGDEVEGVDDELGLGHTDPSPTAWGATRTDAADQVKLLGLLVSGSVPSHGRVLGLMGRVTREQRWGIGAAARPGDEVALKNGWTPTFHQGDGWAVNSIGRIAGEGRDLLLAVLSADQPDMATGVRTVERLSELAVEELTGPGDA